jgi:hypothetical protein
VVIRLTVRRFFCGGPGCKLSIPRAELDTLQAENRRLRREAGDAEARGIRSESGESRAFTREKLAEAWGISE